MGLNICGIVCVSSVSLPMTDVSKQWAGFASAQRRRGSHASFFSGGQRRALEYEREHLDFLHSGNVSAALAQHLFGMGMAFAAAGTDTQLIAQLGHRRHSRSYHLADFVIGNVLANADNH